MCSYFSTFLSRVYLLLNKDFKGGLMTTKANFPVTAGSIVVPYGHVIGNEKWRGSELAQRLQGKHKQIGRGKASQANHPPLLPSKVKRLESALLCACLIPYLIRTMVAGWKIPFVWHVSARSAQFSQLQSTAGKQHNLLLWGFADKHLH